MKRFACLILVALMALSLAACGTQKRETLELFAMDTYMTFVAIGDGADDVLADLSRTVNTLESSLSRTVDTSEVSRLNRSAVWDEDGAQLLSWALQHSQETDGAFDITIAPLVELWGITSDSPRVPSQAEIDALLPLVGYEHVHQSEFCSISLDEGCSVDLGGIAKGWTADQLREYARELGAERGYVSLGGNLMTDAFGVVALVALTPLIAIQFMGLVYKLKTAKRTQTVPAAIADDCDMIVDLEEGD